MKNQQSLSIRFEDEVEHKSLYPWALQEFDREGKQVGGDQIPWEWHLWFSATSLKYVENYSHDGYEYPLGEEEEFNLDEAKEVKEDLAISIDCSRVISASLTPGRLNIDKNQLEDENWYSFFGTDRAIKDIRLTIRESGESDQETCYLEGILSYILDLDYKEVVVDDLLEIQLRLAQEKFNSIAASIKAGEIDWLGIRVGRVSGFYSRWTPNVHSFDVIKVLPRRVLNELKIDNIEEEKLRRLPSLGKVEQFELSLGKKSELLSASAIQVGND